MLMHRGQKIDRKVNKGDRLAHQNTVQSKLATKIHPPCLLGTWLDNNSYKTCTFCMYYAC